MVSRPDLQPEETTDDQAMKHPLLEELFYANH